MSEPGEPLPLPPPEKDFSAVLNAFDEINCTIPDFLLALLTEKHFKDSAYSHELLQRSHVVLGTWLSHPKLPKEAQKMASEALHQLYAHEIRYLTKPSSGWHFSAQTVMPDNIDDFDLSTLTLDTATNAPLVSALLDTLLSANTKVCTSQLQASETDADGDTAMAAAGDSGSDGNGTADVNDEEATLEGVQETKKRECSSKCKVALLKIVRCFYFICRKFK